MASYFLSNASGLMSSVRVTRASIERAVALLLRRPLPPLPRSSKLEVAVLGTSTAYYMVSAVTLRV